MTSNDRYSTATRSTGLVEVLDRVLDKGLVVAGDVRISLAEVELLTIRVRLIICSIDKAAEVGLDWWRHDRYFAPGVSKLPAEHETLEERLRLLEARVASGSTGRRRRATTRRRTSKEGRR